MLTAEASRRQGAGAGAKRIFGFEIIDAIGEGAGSAIYVAAHPETRQLYALKHVVVRKEKEERFLQQLANEFEVARRFSHPVLRKCFELRDNKTLLRKATEAALLMELF